MYVAKPFSFSFGLITIFVAGVFALLYYNQGVRTLNDSIDLSFSQLGVMARTSFVWLTILGGYHVYDSVHVKRIPLSLFLFGLFLGMLGLLLAFLPIMWVGEFFMWAALPVLALGGLAVCVRALSNACVVAETTTAAT